MWTGRETWPGLVMAKRLVAAFIAFRVDPLSSILFGSSFSGNPRFGSETEAESGRSRPGLNQFPWINRAEGTRARLKHGTFVIQKRSQERRRDMLTTWSGYALAWRRFAKAWRPMESRSPARRRHETTSLRRVTSPEIAPHRGDVDFKLVICLVPGIQEANNADA